MGSLIQATPLLARAEPAMEYEGFTHEESLF